MISWVFHQFRYIYSTFSFPTLSSAFAVAKNGFPKIIGAWLKFFITFISMKINFSMKKIFLCLISFDSATGVRLGLRIMEKGGPSCPAGDTD